MKTILTIFMSFYFLTINAQIDDLVNHSDIIVEGRVLSIKAVWNDTKTLINTEHKILVKSLFKGNINDSIIIVLTSGGLIDENLHYSTHQPNLSVDKKAILFLKENTAKRFKVLGARNGMFVIQGDYFEKVLYNDEVISKIQFEEKIINITNYPKLNYKNYSSVFGTTSLTQMDTCDILSILPPQKTIDFTFENVHYTDNYTNIEFDIMAKVNTPGLKFGKGLLHINYSDAFGSNVVSNQTVKIRKGTILNDTLYNINYHDSTNQIISIAMNSDMGSNELFTFSASKASIIHVILKVENITQIGEISFDDIDIKGDIYYWCDGEYSLFDDVLLDDPIVGTDPQPGSEIKILYTFENGQTIENNSKFQVDIYAKSQQLTKYSGGNIEIQYNADAFGGNVVTNAKATFVKGPLISNEDVYTSHFFKDVPMVDNLIQIFSFSDPTITSGRTDLGTQPIKLGTLTFEIEDCDADKGLNFDNYGTVEHGNHLYYTGAMPIPNEKYDPVVADDVETGKACNCDKPIISSFSPMTIHAGTGEILTINGSNFGLWDKNKCTVQFPDGDDGGFSMMEAGAQDFIWDDIIHWTNTKIDIKVPSTDKKEGADNPASTGKFKVKNSCGESQESSNTLQIPYAILNHRGGSMPFHKTLKMTLQEISNPGICLHFTSDMPGWMIDQFKLALQSWCTETSINILIGESVDESINLGRDDINIIKYLGNTTATGGEFVISKSYYYPACHFTESGLPFNEIDFGLYGRDIMSPSNEEEEKLREVAKHELGHALMLTHAKSGGGIQYLMYYMGNSGGVRTPSDNEGANLVFDNSIAIVSNCGIPISKGLCLQSCENTSVKDASLNKVLEILPNPTPENVSIINSRNEIEMVRLLSTEGVVLKSIPVLEGSNIINIELPPISGIYFIKITYNNSFSIHKVIKL